MPISRYQIRNVYNLADPELYKAADRDDPEALLEGVAMAGLVGVLRQLGDLAEFAAEIFHDLHEEVMATATRGHGLLVRVQQLESEIPSIERAFLSQTSHSIFFPNSGADWHPNRQTTQNLITTGDLPRFVMDSYEECRGPPRLFLLDKFDVGGAGACLKRYTDPSIYKVEASSYEIESAGTQRDKKIRKTKKKGSRWKGGETPEVSQPSHVKLHQLFLEERVQNGAIEPARRVKLKKRPNKFPFDSENGESYMNKLLNSPLEDKLVHEVRIHSPTLTSLFHTSNGSRLEIVEDSMVGSALGSEMQNRSPSVSSSVEKTVCEDLIDNLSMKVAPTSVHEEVDEKQIAVYEEIKTDALQNGYQSDDVASETDNYMDALATMESELETDAELRAKTDPIINPGTYSDENVDQLQSRLSDSQSTASDDGNDSLRKGTTMSLSSDTTITTTENASPVGVRSPPRPFACIEIPFHPRVPPKQVSIDEKIPVTQHPNHDITNDTCIDSALHVDKVAILEEGTSKEADSDEVSTNHNENLNSPNKNEHQKDLDVVDYGQSSCAINLEGEMDNKHTNDSSTPMLPLPNILDTTSKISEMSSDNVNQVEYAEDNHSTVSVNSQCSSPRSFISHVNELPLGPNLAAREIHDLDVNPSETTFSDDIPVAEQTADNPDLYSLPEEQVKETGDDVAHIFDSAETRVSYSSEDETESKNSETEVVTGAVSDLADANRSRSDDRSAPEDEPESEDSEIESVHTEVEVGSKTVSVPDLSTLENDTELEGREADSVNSEMEKSAAVNLSVDVNKNEDDSRFTLEEPDESRSVINQDSKESGEKEEVDQLLVISPDSDYVPCDTAPYDSSTKPLLDNMHYSSLCDDLNDDVEIPSLNSKIFQDQSHLFLAETDQNGPQAVVLHDLGSQPGNVAHSGLSNVQLLDSAPGSTVFTEADHNLESKSLNHDDHIYIFEAAESSLLDNKVDQPDGHLHVQLPLASEGTELLSQLDSLTHSDHEVHFDTHAEPLTTVVASQQPSPESYSDPVSEKPPTLELPKVNSQDIDLSDQVTHQSTPVFPGFGILPQLSPVKLEDMPPLPPLPPMQWRMKKLQNTSLTPDGGQNFPSKPNEGPQLVDYPTLDEIRNPGTENQKSQNVHETEDHEKSEAKSAESLVPQAAIETEHSRNVPTTSGQEIFWPTSNPNSIPLVNEMPNNIRPMKIQRPRSPLIDAVAAHDKSKLRKVSDRATHQVPKEEESDTLLEQIRAKSVNLKPAVQTRPSIQGPTTNLRVAAILEKANAIRQAFAGSDDDDDDSDSWSDS